MEREPARKEARVTISDFFAKADCHIDGRNKQSASVNLLSIAEPKEALGPEPEEERYCFWPQTLYKTHVIILIVGMLNNAAIFIKHTVGCVTVTDRLVAISVEV